MAVSASRVRVFIYFHKRTHTHCHTDGLTNSALVFESSFAGIQLHFPNANVRGNKWTAFIGNCERLLLLVLFTVTFSLNRLRFLQQIFQQIFHFALDSLTFHSLAIISLASLECTFVIESKIRPPKSSRDASAKAKWNCEISVHLISMCNRSL